MSSPLQGTKSLVNTCSTTWHLVLPNTMLGNNRTTMKMADKRTTNKTQTQPEVTTHKFHEGLWT